MAVNVCKQSVTEKVRTGIKSRRHKLVTQFDMWVISFQIRSIARVRVMFTRSVCLYHKISEGRTLISRKHMGSGGKPQATMQCFCCFKVKNTEF